MMNERLKLAHQLLKDDGVIFVSIDDTEQAYLKILMDEIFGEENFISCLTWIKKRGPGGNTSLNYNIVKNTEYILLYSKNNQKVNFNYSIHNENKLKQLGYVNKDEYFNERGYYKLTYLFHPSSTGSFQYLKSLDYPIKAPDGSDFMLHVNKYKPESGRYTWGYDAYLSGSKLGFIECKKNEDNEWVAFRKQYQYAKFDPRKKEIVYLKAGQQYENIIDGIYSQQGGEYMKSILNSKNAFDFPKPVKLISFLINLIPNKNARILDFFAGSGTTGHAVLQLNEEDDGNRTFTLVTNNENKIAENVCYERLFRINNGEGTNKEKDFDWLKNNEPYKQNLDVFKVDYFDTNIYSGDNTIIKQTFINELNDFNIFNSDDYYTKHNRELLLNLTSLKPQKEDK